LRLLKQFIGGYLLGVALTIVVFILASTAHCAVGKKHDNSLGVVMEFDNVFTYKAGSVVAVAYVDGGIVVRMQPLGMYSLYTEDILLCGSPVLLFENKTNPMVLTYRTKASRLIEGIGCHELNNVSSLKTEKLQ
jgi:hypothetical protein